MTFNRQGAFAQQQPTTQRAGVFGANRTGQQDRAALGAQRATNALQGRVQGGNRPGVFGQTKARVQGNRQRQLFSQRVAPKQGPSRVPVPRVPQARGGQVRRTQPIQPVPTPVRARQFGTFATSRRGF